MRTDNKYYGEAIREMESGIRRDNIWGRAVAESAGDVQRSQSLYVEFLARQLAIEDGQPSRQQQLENLQKHAKKTARSTFWWACCVCICGALAIGGAALAEKIYYESNYQAAHSNMPEYIDDSLHKLQDNLSSRGYPISFEQLQEDWTLTFGQLMEKYPNQVAIAINNIGSAVINKDYFDKTNSDMSTNSQMLTAVGIFVALLACSVFWRRRKQSAIRH